MTLAAYKGDVAGISLPINKNNLLVRAGRIGFAFYNSLEIGIEGLLHTALIPGKNFLMRKDTLKSVYGFNNSLVEDLNFSVKIHRAGKKIRLVPAYCYEQIPDKFKWYFKQQERWLVGTGNEILDSLKSLSFIELIVFLPYLILRGLFPLISFVLLVLYFMFGGIILLSGAMLGILILFLGTLRFLDRDDIIWFPVAFLVYSLMSILFLANAVLKLRKKEKWYKTPKECYGPSKPQLEHT